MSQMTKTNEKKHDVVLAYLNDSVRGPGKVVSNLTKGLTLIGAKVKRIADSGHQPSDYWGVLQTLKSEHMHLLTGDVPLAGPNLFVVPDEWSPVWLKKFNHYVVPSEWVKNLYRKYPGLDHATIDVWSVGIDTEEWKPKPRELKTVGPILGASLKCLLYVKNRHQQDVNLVKRILDKYLVEFRVIEYGQYSEAQLKDACHWANMGVLVTDTESQGIAYMEMLSTNLPLFVFNKSWWNYDGKVEEVPASSTPYFDSRCGETTDVVDLQLFQKFLDNVRQGKYSPREYILENHTLEKSAEKYYSLLEKYQ